MTNVRRIYVEKRKEYATEAHEIQTNLVEQLGLTIHSLRIVHRYDVQGISEEILQQGITTILAEPMVDHVYDEIFPMSEKESVFAIEFLPGQYDQRADSCEQCFQILTGTSSTKVRCAKLIVVDIDKNEDVLNQIKHYLINPVDQRIASLEKPEHLNDETPDIKSVPTLTGFNDLDETGLNQFLKDNGMAMNLDDLKVTQDYFKNEEHRDPTETEIKVLDTYWSDHCRHTTFSTELTNIGFQDGFYRAPLEEAYYSYMDDFEEMYKDRDDKYVCLMDMALMAMKRLKKDGVLDNMEESDEINACSIVVPVEIDGKEEEWLISFKNETHNHPTEIEPFGGAATCLGGAIRDPLSGRSYVYQAMRVTGAADPTVPLKDTLKGKLPQYKIVNEAANGYSSYGNQIGLATGYVNEVYHPDYVAKRMEIGAVMGAAPRKNVIRENSDPGDIIILLGGRTGRDGCGGATGSSKVHTEESIETCGAEVQKGNPPTERKIQRLFRREEVSRLIKKCNDFGAGGVSVAIGELADGLIVDLDKVPKKYAGLDGTELAISESQERMAVVVDPKDVEQFLAYSAEENLEAVEVAVVTEDPRLILKWRGKEIVNISRAFLDTNGAHQETEVFVEIPHRVESYFNRKDETGTFEEVCKNTLSDLNVCSQKGLVERFDSSIGAATVTMPYGGKYQLTPIQTMIAKLPVLKGKCDTVTMMSYGFDPYLSKWSPFHGAVYAITESIAKIVASGGDYRNIRLTFQEYFKRLGEDKTRWGQPVAALLGAYQAQMGFGLASIGGKDSMSGTFNDIDVPPTLVSFAVDVAKTTDIITPELKKAGNRLVRICIPTDAYNLPIYSEVKKVYKRVTKLIKDGAIKSAYAIGGGGALEAVAKMAFGNKLGVIFDEEVELKDLTDPKFGSFVVEMDTRDIHKLGIPGLLIGEITEKHEIVFGDEVVTLEEAIDTWQKPLEKVFPTKSEGSQNIVDTTRHYTKGNIYVCKNKVAKPNVFIPVFPGTNCEYDSAKAFERAGANVITKVFKNLDAQGIRDSVEVFEKAINESQIIMFPGGFSAGDEPDGSAKFFATAFRNEKLKEAVMDLLDNRDGLVLGICNGFQALIKLGLVPEGKIVEQNAKSPTLTTNRIGRHVSKVAYTRIASNLSPWFNNVNVDDVFSIPVSHGEGRFVADEDVIQELFKNGQVATQYVDLNGDPTMNEEFNPNGSYHAIEGITSPDGRVLGKMGHSERRDSYVGINIYGQKDQKIFESGVEYFK